MLRQASSSSTRCEKSVSALSEIAVAASPFVNGRQDLVELQAKQMMMMMMMMMMVMMLLMMMMMMMMILPREGGQGYITGAFAVRMVVSPQ